MKTTLSLCLLFTLTSCASAPAPHLQNLPEERPLADDLSLMENARRDRVIGHLAGNGFEVLEDKYGSISIPPGSVVTQSVDAQAGQCIIAVYFGETKGLKIIIQDSKGTKIGKPKRDTRVAWRKFCAKQDGSHLIKLESNTKNSELPYAFLSGKSSDKTNLTQYFAGTQSTPGRTNSGALIKRLENTGYKVHQGFSPLSKGPISRVTLQLAKGCYLVSVIGPGLEDTSLSATAKPILTTLINTTDRPDSKAIRLCSEKGTSLSINVETTKNAKLQLGIFEWKRGTRGPFHLRDVGYLQSSEITHWFTEMGFHPNAAFTPERGTASKTKSEKHTLPLSDHTCFAVYAIAEQGKIRPKLSLRIKGLVVAENSDNHGFSYLRHCTIESTTAELSISSFSGTGSYFTQVFSKER